MEVTVTSFHLEQFPVFEGLPKPLLDKIAKLTSLRTRPSSSVIYSPGDPADTVYFMSEGRIKVGNLSHDGKEVLRAVIRPGQIFGELGLAGRTTRDELAVSIRLECSYYAIKTTDLRDAMEESTELSFRILKGIGERVSNTDRRLEAFLFKDSRTRIIDFILNHVDETGVKNEKGHVFYHYMTHQDVANITGTSRQFVTGVLNKLRKDGFIEFNRISMTVKNLKGLRKQAVSGVDEHV